MNKKIYLIFGIFLIILGIIYLGINITAFFGLISILINLLQISVIIIPGVFFIKFARKNRIETKLIKIAFYISILGIILYFPYLLIYYFVSTTSPIFNITLIFNHNLLGTIMNFLFLTSLILLLIDYLKNKKSKVLTQEVSQTQE